MTPWRFKAIEWCQTGRGPVAIISAEYTYSDLQQLIGHDVEIDGRRHKVLGVEAFMTNPPKGPYGLLVAVRADVMTREIPDFDLEQIAELRKYFMDDGPGRESRQNKLLDQILRLVWNARGAADRRALADLLIAQPSNISQPVQYAIKKLDR